MPEKPNREAFEKQCEEISNKLDNLSDWEMKFYLYCLIPKYIKILQKQDAETEIKTPHDVCAVDGLRRLEGQLNTAVRMLAVELFC